jgi:hypothetical protein
VVSVGVPLTTTAQTADSSIAGVIGYKDANHDGINDLFCDKNGDGVNDVDNAPYKHTFKIVDSDNDNMNDLWIDADGDGVNDLMIPQLKKLGKTPHYPWIDRDGDGIRDADVAPTYDVDLCLFVVDSNSDGKNDITGQAIDQNHVWGFRFGSTDEENNQHVNNYQDRDVDGMHDGFSRRLQQTIDWQHIGRQFDYFIDKDGDGISDERGLGRLGNRRQGQGQGNDRKQRH